MRIDCSSLSEIDIAIECSSESDAKSCLTFEDEAKLDSMINSKTIDARFARSTMTAMREMSETCTSSRMRIDAMKSEV